MAGRKSRHVSLKGREQIIAFLRGKWAKEPDHRQDRELCLGLMQLRYASINDLPIAGFERKLRRERKV